MFSRQPQPNRFKLSKGLRQLSNIPCVMTSACNICPRFSYRRCHLRKDVCVSLLHMLESRLLYGYFRYRNVFSGAQKSGGDRGTNSLILMLSSTPPPSSLPTHNCLWNIILLEIPLRNRCPTDAVCTAVSFFPLWLKPLIDIECYY